MIHLFAYGTLMCEDIMHEVAGCSVRSVSAVLDGYCRLRVRDETYPGLIRRAGAAVEGVLYRDIPKSAWKRLDRFEGAMYVRQSLRVRTEDGALVPADTYVVRPRDRHRLVAADWDFDEFLAGGKDRFRAGYRGYRAIQSRDNP